jgi:hypothetical protein
MPSGEESDFNKRTMHDQFTALKHLHKITHLPPNRPYKNLANPQK